MEEFKNVAGNIRKYRKRKNLTQAQLAEMFSVTSQNISKWEKGISMPDISNLWKLAQFFSISLEELLGVSSAPKRCKAMIAIDGGGTKTEFILFDDKGRVIKRKISGGSNMNSLGSQTAFSVIKSGIEDLLLESCDVSAIYAGISGCGLEDNRKKMLMFLKRNFSDIKIDVRSDLTNVMCSSMDCSKMISVICGTGSIVCAKTLTATHNIGGWGYALDSGGSGYDFGRDAICAALSERDGIGDKTLITSYVEQKLNGNVRDKISYIYSNGKDYIASFAGMVFRAFNEGDRVAEEIVDRNMDRLYFLIKSAYDMYDCGNIVVISGGLVSQKEILGNRLRSRAGNKLRFIFNDIPPIVGAAVCCIRNLYDPDADIPEFRRSFISSYEKYMCEEKYD